MLIVDNNFRTRAPVVLSSVENPLLVYWRIY